MVKRCCICGVELTNWGNNPDGAVWKDKRGNIVEAEFDEDCRCCDECNQRYVIPGRLYRMNKNREAK